MKRNVFGWHVTDKDQILYALNPTIYDMHWERNSVTIDSVKDIENWHVRIQIRIRLQRCWIREFLLCINRELHNDFDLCLTKFEFHAD